jgi:hypothetical protein
MIALIRALLISSIVFVSAPAFADPPRPKDVPTKRSPATSKSGTRQLDYAALFGRGNRFPLPRPPHFPDMPYAIHDIFVDGDYLYASVGSSRAPLWRMRRSAGQWESLIPPSVNKMLSFPALWKGRIFLSGLKRLWSVPKNGGIPKGEEKLKGRRVYAYRGVLYATAFRSRDIERLRPGRRKRIARTASSPALLRFAGNYIYAALYKVGHVVRIPLKGGKPRVLASRQRRVVDALIVGDYLYWSAETAGEIRRRRKNGRGRIETIAKKQVNAECLNSHRGVLYWRNWAGGRGNHKIMRYDPKTRKVSVALGGLSMPNETAFDEKYMYVSEKGTGSVIRVPLR